MTAALTFLRRAARAVRSMPGAFVTAWRVTADARSFARCAADVVLFRIVRLGWLDGGAERRIRLETGAEIGYRLDQGDVRAILEVWGEQPYRLPDGTRPRGIVDLGANIGLASVWLARRYGCERLVAVEPSPANARLARANLSANGVPGEVLEAAVGDSDGTGFLDTGWSDAEHDSALGALGSSGIEVRTVSMATVLDALGPDVPPDVVKIDIEGGEAALLAGDLSWLDRVRFVVAELHCHVVDCEEIARTLAAVGFERELRFVEPSGGLQIAAFARREGA